MHDYQKRAYSSIDECCIGQFLQTNGPLFRLEMLIFLPKLEYIFLFTILIWCTQKENTKFQTVKLYDEMQTTSRITLFSNWWTRTLPLTSTNNITKILKYLLLARVYTTNNYGQDSTLQL